MTELMTEPVKVRGIAIGEGRPKICVPIVEKTAEEIRDKALALKSVPLDLVEWRTDWYEEGGCPQKCLEVLGDLREILGNIPLLYTFRTKGEGGVKAIEKSRYLELNARIAESGLADLIDLELFTACGAEKPVVEAAQKAGVLVVMSSHDFEKTPSGEEIMNRLKKMDEAGAHILKIAVMPQNTEDVLTLLAATREAAEKTKKPLITMAMGGTGLVSRLAGELWGSAVTFGSAGTASAPGQIDAALLKTILETIHGGMVSGEKKETRLKKHIFLIGFMGTGKTTVSAALSAICGCRILEMDQCIEAEEGIPIRDIFSRHGEEYFRDLETALLEKISREEPAVVSCGGGAVLRKKNVEMMKASGTIVLLTAEPETVLERVKGDDSRPNLKGRMSAEGIRDLMDQRREAYHRAADTAVSTDGKEPEKIAGEILQFLRYL